MLLKTTTHTKAYFTIGLLCCITTLCLSQDQRVADSLKKIYNHNELSDSKKLEVLRNISLNERKADTSIYYSNELISLASKLNSKLYLHRGYLQRGHALREKGNLDKAAESFFKSAEIANSMSYISGVGGSYLALGDVYSVEGDHINSTNYYNKAISILRSETDSIPLATALLNAGDEYFNADKLDSAILLFEESGKIFKNQNYLIGTAYNLGNVGMVYAKQDQPEKAESNMQLAIEILSELGDYYPIAVYDTYISDIYLEKGDFDRALQYAQHSLDIATDHGLKEQIRDASLKLAELYEYKEEYQTAFEYQKQYLAYRDSINNEETVRKMADLRTEYEVSQKQIEIDLLESRQRMQNILFASMSTIIILLAFLAFMYYRNNKRKQMLNMIITERKEEVEAQRDQLEAMNETREKFLSIIAHDLLGPVNSFKGFSTIMKFSIDQNDTEDLKQIHSQFEKSVDGLSSLLTNLLDWSVTQQGTIPYKPEKLELKSLVDELVDLFKNMADTKKIKLMSAIDKRVDIWADINSVKTILRNLVSNAIKFTVDGGSITISAQTDGSMVNVKVQDTGIGIPQEKLETLLAENNFNRSWGTKGEKGLGLGLQLVKEFTEINKGQLAIESVEGKGTSISVTLPLFSSKTQQ
jgi:two-component system NtrC family sensor kinase